MTQAQIGQWMSWGNWAGSPGRDQGRAIARGCAAAGLGILGWCICLSIHPSIYIHPLLGMGWCFQTQRVLGDTGTRAVPSSLPRKGVDAHGVLRSPSHPQGQCRFQSADSETPARWICLVTGETGLKNLFLFCCLMSFLALRTGSGPAWVGMLLGFAKLESRLTTPGPCPSSLGL